MTSLTLETPRSVINWPALRSHASAAAIAVALHAGLAWVLVSLSHDQPAALEVAQAPALLKTQLIQLPQPVPVVEAPAPVPPPVPVPPEPAPVPEPVVKRQAPEQADLAFKRAEQAREEEAQRKRQQEQAERKRKQQEELAQARERQRLEEQQQAQRREEAQRQVALAAQRAEADRQAAAAAAANARAQAEAAAASRQYLPIAKEAPAYPQRALDRNIQGECTVSYTVNPNGRVEDPKVLDDCHPLFKSPSLAAAKRFRYQPRIVNGQAVPVPDVKNTFSYRIE
ncbi:energy transducer TonB [Stutzerimonas zhaodongensis]|uniref:energy transducer TonB n=1 Tax=Stutzerimonas TaxID=2901164 RepID=UPI00388F09C8